MSLCCWLCRDDMWVKPVLRGWWSPSVAKPWLVTQYLHGDLRLLSLPVWVQAGLTAWHSMTYCRHLREGVTFQVSPSEAVCFLVCCAPLSSMFCVVWAVKEQVSIYKDDSTICPGTAQLSAQTHAQGGQKHVAPPASHCKWNSSSCIT